MKTITVEVDVDVDDVLEGLSVEDLRGALADRGEERAVLRIDGEALRRAVEDGDVDRIVEMASEAVLERYGVRMRVRGVA